MKEQEILDTIDMKGMGQRIRAQREAIHMTRAELADKLTVSSKFVSDIEGGKGVSIKTLYKLSQILHLTTDYILAGDKKDVAKGVDPEAERIKENILGPLSTCNKAQLKCMEQIARFYVEAIVGTE